MGRGAAELGGAQGALVQPARQAAGRARGGPSAGVPQLRGNHSAGRVRRRHGDALGRGVLGTARRRRGGPARRRAEVRAGRPAPQGRLGARAAEAQGGRARRQLAPHQGEGRARAGRARHRRLRHERAHGPHHGRDSVRRRRAACAQPLRPRRRGAGEARVGGAEGRRVGVRGEVRRLPHACVRGGEPRAAGQPQRQGLHRAFPRHRRRACRLVRRPRVRAGRRGGDDRR